MRVLLILTMFFFAGCSDVLPEKQCDPDRRCTAGDTPVCGDDGRWYECGLVAECEEVPVAISDSVCGERPDEPDPECPEIACAACDNRVDTYDEDGCLTACECPDPPDCPAVELDCEQPRTDANGCPVCVDECPTRTCDAAGCQLVTPRGGGCPQCVCEPLCEPPNPTCESDPTCTLVTTANGCQTCQCEEEGVCPRMLCDAQFCQHGYVIDAEGCPTCECYEPCQVLPECQLACPTGNQIDVATGCVNSCECLADSCDPVACTLFCDWGFRTDSTGCEVCECKQQPCDFDEDCALGERCVVVGDVTFNAGADAPVAPPQGLGECVALDRCDANSQCEDGGQCGFYYRNDCCPPKTSCAGALPACLEVCLFDVGDLG